MEVRGLIRKGNPLQMQLQLALENSHANNCQLATTMSPEYIICGSTVFQVKVISSFGKFSLNNLVFIKFNKQRQNDNSTYTMTITSNELCLKNKCFTSDDSIWRLVCGNIHLYNYTIDVTVQVDLVRSVNTYVPLHEDIQLTDFELRGEDGSVHFHKAVLAVSSPVLMTMLGGKWRETTQGHVDIPGTSKKTLQDLKNYIYLHTLPDEDLEQLLLLSLYYMMLDLEQRCVDKLVNSLTAQNVCDLLEFGVQHKVKRLEVAILECAQSHSIHVNEVRAHYLGGGDSPSGKPIAS